MTVNIHIGYHKTATTWLQRQVFVPQMGFAQILNHEEVNRLIIQPHDLSFDPLPAQNCLKQRLKDLPNGACPIVSSENLSGHPFFGGRQSATLAYRLQKIAPTARIIITLRSQETILPSVYMQYLQRGGTLTPQAFFRGTNQYGYPGFEAQHFFYDHLIALYQSLFNTVHVMTYEQMSHDPSRTLTRLGKAIECHINTENISNETKVGASAPQAISPWLRRINHTRQSTLNPAPAIVLSREPGWMYRAICSGASSKIAKPFLKNRPVDDYVKVKFANVFSQSNQRLNTLTNGGLNLTSYP